MTSPEIRLDALRRMRQASVTPQERHEGLSEFIRAFLVMVLLVAAFISLSYAAAAMAMVPR